MKIEYTTPELELLKFKLTSDVLAISDPDSGVNTGTGTGQDTPGVDPFGDPDLDP